MLRLVYSPKSENCYEEVEHYQKAEDLEIDANLTAEPTLDFFHWAVEDVDVLKGLSIPTANFFKKQRWEELAVFHRRAIRTKTWPSINTAEKTSSDKSFSCKWLWHWLDGIDSGLLRLEVHLHEMVVLLNFMRDLLDLVRFAEKRSILRHS